MEEYYSNGKLLITGEYAVLDGAAALAVPTKFGQSLKINPRRENGIHWTSLDHENQPWFEATFKMGEEHSFESSNAGVAERLLSILAEAHKTNPSALANEKGFEITAKLDFPTNWGLGSSSTLVNNIAQWFKIDAFTLLENTFGGSGYDIAAAQQDHSIIFERTPTGPQILSAGFNPAFREELFFVHQNQKQDSRSSIHHYRQQDTSLQQDTIQKISALTHQLITSSSITEFELLLNIHETLISKLVGLPKVKSLLFPSYPRSIKSLGGWGGDFILATGGEKEREYFRERGYSTIVSYEEMVLE